MTCLEKIFTTPRVGEAGGERVFCRAGGVDEGRALFGSQP